MLKMWAARSAWAIPGCLLLVAGVTKVILPAQTALASRWMFLVGIAEIFVGMLCLLPSLRRPGLQLASLMLLAFVGFNLAYVLGGDGDQACGCYGRVHDTSHAQALLVAGVMLGACALAQAPCLDSRPPGWPRRILPAIALLAGLVAAIGGPDSAEPRERPRLEPGRSGPAAVPLPALEGPRLLSRGPSDEEPRQEHLLVRITTPARKPAEGVHVWWEPSGATDVIRVATDSQGTARLTPQSQDRRLVGHVPNGPWLSAVVPADSREVELTLPDEIVLLGTVLDPFDNPMPGMRLRVAGTIGASDPTRMALQAPSYGLRAESADLVTDAQGRFEVRGWESAKATLVSQTPGVRLLSPRGYWSTELPRHGLTVRAARVLRTTFQCRDMLTKMPVPPPIRLELEDWPEGVGAALVQANQATGWITVDALQEPSDHRCRVSVAARNYATSGLDFRAGAPDTLQDQTLWMTRKQEAAPTCDLLVDWPIPFAGVRWASSLDLVAADAVVDRMVIKESSTWILPQAPTGRYDLVYLGQTIARGVELPAGGTVRVVGNLEAFVRVELELCGPDGLPVIGLFAVAVGSNGMGGGGGEYTASERGIIDLGYCAPGRLSVFVGRSTHSSADHVAIEIVPGQQSPLRVRVEMRSHQGAARPAAEPK